MQAKKAKKLAVGHGLPLGHGDKDAQARVISRVDAQVSALWEDAPPNSLVLVLGLGGNTTYTRWLQETKLRRQQVCTTKNPRMASLAQISRRAVVTTVVDLHLGKLAGAVYMWCAAVSMVPPPLLFAQPIIWRQSFLRGSRCGILRLGVPCRGWMACQPGVLPVMSICGRAWTTPSVAASLPLSSHLRVRTSRESVLYERVCNTGSS